MFPIRKKWADMVMVASGLLLIVFAAGATFFPSLAPMLVYPMIICSVSFGLSFVNFILWDGKTDEHL